MTEIPERVLAEIEAMEAQRQLELEQIQKRQEAEERDRREAFEARSLAARTAVLPRLPEWLRPYVQLPTWGVDYDTRGAEVALPVEIPGLAPFALVFIWRDGEPQRFSWVFASFDEPSTYWEDDPSELDELAITWRWRRGYGSSANVVRFDEPIGAVLAEARRRMDEFRAAGERLKRGIATEKARHAVNEQARQQEEDAAQALVRVFRTDPVAMALLRVFAALQDERREMYEVLESADSWRVSMEHRYQEALNSAKRQAAQLDVRLRDEEERRCALEDELRTANVRRKWCRLA